MSGWLRRISAAYANLSPRERLLVTAAGGLVALAILYAGAVRPILDFGASAAARVDTSRQTLQAVTRMRREFDDVNQRLVDVESRIKTGSSGNLRTKLEMLAEHASVKVESMEPQASPANERYRETKVAVGLKGVSLPQTVDYLARIETDPQVLSVKTLRIRTRPDKADLLDVTFTVSSFEPI